MMNKKELILLKRKLNVLESTSEGKNSFISKYSVHKETALAIDTLLDARGNTFPTFADLSFKNKKNIGNNNLDYLEKPKTNNLLLSKLDLEPRVINRRKKGMIIDLEEEDGSSIFSLKKKI